MLEIWGTQVATHRQQWVAHTTLAAKHIILETKWTKSFHSEVLYMLGLATEFLKADSIKMKASKKRTLGIMGQKRGSIPFPEVNSFPFAKNPEWIDSNLWSVLDSLIL